MERNSSSSDSSYAVKEEPECSFNQREHKTEVVVKVEHIKEELEWKDSGSYDESESLEQSDLYADHDVKDVKDELVLGPEGLQTPDMAFTFYAQALAVKQHKVKDCVVMLERIDLDGQLPSAATATHPSTRESLTSDTHSTQNYYICAICNWRFKLKSRLKEHVMVHIHESTAEESNVEFVLSAETADGRGSHHIEHAYAQIENPLPEVIALKCETCNKKFDSARQLKRHQRAHPRVKPYSSSMADKTSESEGEIDVVSLGPQIPLALSPDPPSGRRHRRLRQKRSPPATVATAATSRYGLRARARWHIGYQSDLDTHTYTNDTIRETKNVKERYRRIYFRGLFDELRTQIPKIKDKNFAPKIRIIKEATALCHELREEQKCLEKQQHELMTEFKKLRTIYCHSVKMEN